MEYNSIEMWRNTMCPMQVGYVVDDRLAHIYLYDEFPRPEQRERNYELWQSSFLESIDSAQGITRARLSILETVNTMRHYDIGYVFPQGVCVVTEPLEPSMTLAELFAGDRNTNHLTISKELFDTKQIE